MVGVRDTLGLLRSVVPNQGSMDPYGVRGGSLGGTCLITVITSLIKEEERNSSKK